MQGYVSGHAVTNIFYILRRQVGRETALQLLLRLLKNLQVASVTDEAIRATLQSPMTDFEDAVTSEAAKLAGAEAIVTRNTADFAGSSISAVLPEEFLAGARHFSQTAIGDRSQGSERPIFPLKNPHERTLGSPP